MKKVYVIFLGIIVLLMVSAVSCAPVQEALAGGGAERQETGANWHPQSGEGPVEGASASVVRNDNGASVSFKARELNPDHVYTLWFVVVNSPENCAAYPEGPCGAGPDVLGNTDGVQADVTYVDGIVAGGSGKGTLSGHVSEGDLPNAWFGNRFEDARAAEIHLVVNDHGPKIPGMADDMMHSYRGGCTDDSLPPPFPDTAKSDGTPGPNTCRLYQSAIFEPSE